MSGMNIQMLRERARTSIPGPKRGDELFDGTSYPRTWDTFVGQEDAVDFLRAACKSAQIRGERLDHVLIATGAHGVGKSSLARLVAHEMGVGLVEVQGVVTERDAIRLFASMSDGDILFYDEFHLAVSKGKAKAEWLLSVLQDGVMVTSSGVVPIPNVTIMAATTDIQMVQETIISRFTVKPAMAEYTSEQAQVITRVTAQRIWKGLNLPTPDDETCARVARAGNNNPREIMQLLKTLRDSVLAEKEVYTRDGAYGLTTMHKWSQVTYDGLDALAQRYLQILGLQYNGEAGEKTMTQSLGEKTTPRHTEKMLIAKGYLTIGAKGRVLTQEGEERLKDLLAELG